MISSEHRQRCGCANYKYTQLCLFMPYCVIRQHNLRNNSYGYLHTTNFLVSYIFTTIYTAMSRIYTYTPTVCDTITENYSYEQSEIRIVKHLQNLVSPTHSQSNGADTHWLGRVPWTLLVIFPVRVHMHRRWILCTLIVDIGLPSGSSRTPMAAQMSTTLMNIHDIET